MQLSATLQLLIRLLKCPSVTPEDAGCQQIISDYLKPLGFRNEHLKYSDVCNLWACRGDKKPLFVFAGHTDVVPTGAIEQWHSDPFQPEIRAGHLYARGAADMKASIAAMLTATSRFIKAYPEHQGAIGYLITSDEEGPAINGTVKVLEWLQQQQQQQQITYCLVGEPSCSEVLGDTIKNGRRGSLTCNLTVHGTQGHVAYPHLAKNPIHLSTSFLYKLCQIKWDEGNEYFPATTMQIANINAGTGASNVIPGDLQLQFNFRFSTATDYKEIQQTVDQLIETCQLESTVHWVLSGNPFITKVGELTKATQDAIKQTLHIESQLSTSGGTSDGRFIARYGAQIVEFGPLNGTIHKVNECVNVQSVDALSLVYEQILKNLLLV